MINNVFCINLDKRPDRWESCQKEFHRHNISNVLRWSAVDAIELNISPIKAATISHINLLQFCHFININNVIIFEDDIILSDNFSSKLEIYLSELPDNWECFSFHAYNAKTIPISEHTCEIFPDLYGAHGFIINKQGIQKTLLSYHQYDCPENIYLKSLDHVYAPKLEYTLCYQNGKDTDIPDTAVLSAYQEFYNKYHSNE